MARAAAILGAAAGVALFAGLHHSATEMPADKGLGPWSSYFSYNSQVKLVRNPAYHNYVANKLNEMRSVGDKCADDVIGNIPPSLWHHPSLWGLVKIVASKGGSYEDAAASLLADGHAGDFDLRTMTFANDNSAEAKLIQQMRNVPEWVNPAELEVGRQLHEANAIAIGTVLLCGSLVLSYACKNGNKVLMETRRLSTSAEGVWRRLAETWHFVVAVQASKDALAIGNPGYESVASVRLLHSVVRRYCLRKEWNAANYGYPVNQEDMLGTLASFSPCVLIGLERIGINFTPQEQDAYCARWRYVGYLLGLTPEALDLIPNYASSRYVGEVIALRQLSPDEDSTKLTRSSLTAVESHYPLLSKLPVSLKQVLSFWCRWLLGTALADALQITKPKGITLVFWAVIRFSLRFGFFFSRRFALFKYIWLAINNSYQLRVSRAEFPGRKRLPHAFKTG